MLVASFWFPETRSGAARAKGKRDTGKSHGVWTARDEIQQAGAWTVGVGGSP